MRPILHRTAPGPDMQTELHNHSRFCYERTPVSGNRRVSHHTNMEGFRMSSVAGLNVTSTASSYMTAGTSKTNTKETDTKKETGKEESAGAVYDKTSSDSDKKATYSINKMSAEKRAELVKQMKADEEERQNQLVSIVNKMLTGQATKFKQADDSFWSTLAKGGFSVDAAAKAEAQELISEDGYYGVKQTSERIFNFASALAGDDPKKMEEMRKAFEKGFKQATKSWGQDLPSISQETYKAVEKMFDDYADSKKVVTDTEEA